MPNRFPPLRSGRSSRIPPPLPEIRCRNESLFPPLRIHHPAEPVHSAKTTCPTSVSHISPKLSLILLNVSVNQSLHVIHCCGTLSRAENSGETHVCAPSNRCFLLTFLFAVASRRRFRSTPRARV